MKHLLLTSILLLSACFLFAQQPKYVTSASIPYYSESIRGSDNYIKERCVLDVYYPENKTGFATVVWFHGGGLTGGSKEIPEALKDKNICIVAVNYRLSPKVKVKQCIEDAAAAARHRSAD